MEQKFLRTLYQSHQACRKCASPGEVGSVFKELLGLLFADFTSYTFSSEKEFEEHYTEIRDTLAEILQSSSDNPGSGNKIVEKFFNSLPDLYRKINEDVTAMYQGDPAAKSRSEVIRTYPGFYAIAAYRIAHQLHLLGVAEIPRVITEHAHSRTGIDIHPAAKIGDHFCIDHGTGIVIGETAQIGNHVKMYQGVTLGALSVSKQDAEKKRHPTIEDNVVIYAGATILGGETVVGHNSVIGGNVWLTKSTPPNSKIYYQAKMYDSDKDQSDIVVFRADKH